MENEPKSDERCYQLLDYAILEPIPIATHLDVVMKTIDLREK